MTFQIGDHPHCQLNIVGVLPTAQRANFLRLLERAVAMDSKGDDFYGPQDLLERVPLKGALKDNTFWFDTQVPSLTMFLKDQKLSHIWKFQDGQDLYTCQLWDARDDTKHTARMMADTHSPVVSFQDLQNPQTMSKLTDFETRRQALEKAKLIVADTAHEQLAHFKAHPSHQLLPLKA
jgi:hypothetical protein